MGSANVINFKNKTTKINVNIDSLKSTKQKLNAMTSYSEFSDIDSILSERETKSIEKEQARIAAEEAAKKAAEEAAKKEAEKKAKEAAIRQEKLDKLEQLYNEREENNGLFHPFKEQEIEDEIEKLEKELNVEHKPDGWESFCNAAKDAGATAVTFVASGVEGVIDVGETIVDGAVQVGGGLIAEGVSLIDEEAGEAMKQGIQDFVSYDASGALYDEFVSVTGIDEDIAYGAAHTAGNTIGQVAGYATLSMLPGGAAVTAVASGLASAGSSAENAYANGATFDEAMITSTVAGVTGAAAGGAMNKLGTLANTATSLKAVAGYTASGAALGTAEPLINSAVEYATYGNNDGQSYFEYMDESGGWTKVAMGVGAGGLSTGSKALKTYTNIPKRNALNNFKNDPDVTNYNKKTEFANKVAKADRMADYYSKKDVMSKDTFYDVWGAKKGAKPDPSTYLPQEYIDNHLKKFSNGASRLTSEENFAQYNASKMGAGDPRAYKVNGVNYSGGSEFVSPSGTIDEVLSNAQKSKSPIDSIANDLGLDQNAKNSFKNGYRRYDVDASELNDLNIRITNGNEPSAFPLDWIPGGNTLGGKPEAAVDHFNFNGNTIRYSQRMK